MKLGQVPMDTEELNKTADSTFKPKSLRNRAKEKADALVAAEREREEAEEKRRRREDGGAVPQNYLLGILGTVAMVTDCIDDSWDPLTKAKPTC